MNLGTFISDLQKKPYATRIRILWGTVICCSLILVIIWALTLKSSIGGLHEKPAATPATDETAAPSATYVKVERVEIGKSLKVFFSVKNSTNDVLNFSVPEKIKLEVGNTKIAAASVTDRQNLTFVKKILSNTENYGILVFNTESSGTVKITFDQLFFEKHPESIFSETLELDLEKLNKEQELRN